MIITRKTLHDAPEASMFCREHGKYEIGSSNSAQSGGCLKVGEANEKTAATFFRKVSCVVCTEIN
ncbi:hypothetical protein N7520_003031 [Penicillium odoratum]|uniref:uncharacterized protein n=1 Tax=Penicillium odoratum TaxID=1167516 RepID=UPI0025478129|nr:uncharacterized protein N7520_003031 [Penicillium odoratum]KAJ5772502.1 hypothetical protein N7520_003031 [Penicillium odoratum]